MWFFSLLVWGWAIFAMWRWVVRRSHPVREMPPEVHFIQAEDGWRLALSHYPPAKDLLPHGSAKKPYPVLLCPGLASNRFTFDLTMERSLARELANQGYDVWCIELRGHGLSERPALIGGRRFNWSFDDYLHRDAPAAIKAILEKTGAEKLHWIGHSMGGLLLYSYLSTRPDAPIASGITVGSTLNYHGTGSDLARLARFRWLTYILPFAPIGPLTALVSPFVGRWALRPEEFLYYPKNLSPRATRRLCALVADSLSPAVLRQLASALDESGLTSKDGTTAYINGLKNTKTPVLALVGSRDRQCSLEAAQKTLDAFPKGQAHAKAFGIEEGQVEHYGHFDLLVGDRAREEVFPSIFAWLQQYDHTDTRLASSSSFSAPASKDATSLSAATDSKAYTPAASTPSLPPSSPLLLFERAEEDAKGSKGGQG
jgi:polyhydroxyalkanoate synthase